MKTHTDSTATAALVMLGKDGDTITSTANALGIHPAAMLAAAWRVLERQNADAQPWPRLVEGWHDEASATRQDVILAAVRLDAALRSRKAA